MKWVRYVHTVQAGINAAANAGGSRAALWSSTLTRRRCGIERHHFRRCDHPRRSHPQGIGPGGVRAGASPSPARCWTAGVAGDTEYATTWPVSRSLTWDGNQAM